MPGTICPTTVGHIPCEISRYIWYAINLGASISGEVVGTRPKRSPLKQGGLEIPIVVLVAWDDADKLSILIGKVESVDFTSYVDESMEILKDLGLERELEEEEEGEDEEC